MSDVWPEICPKVGGRVARKDVCLDGNFKMFSSMHYGFRYNMMTHYKAHQGIHRVSSKTHICPICYSSFPKQSKLNEHLANQHQSYSAAITSPPATPIPVARLIHSAETLTVDSSPTTSSVTKTSSITPQRRHNFVPISHSRLLEPSDVEEIKQETFVDNS